MKHVFFVSRFDDATFNGFLDNTLKRFNNGVVPIMIADKPGFSTPVTEKYHSGVEAALKTPILDENDIVVFIHEDCVILDSLFIDKLYAVFETHIDVGVVGVTGKKLITDDYNADHKICGQFVQGDPTNPTVSKGIHLSSEVGFFNDVVSVAPFFIAVRSSLLKSGAVDFSKCNPLFYSTDVCIQALRNGYKAAVADILCFHLGRNRERPDYSEEWKSYIDGLEATEHKELFKPIERNNIVSIDL